MPLYDNHCSPPLACPAVAASRLLTNDNVWAAINEVLGALHLSAAQVMARLSEIASANIAEFLTKDWKINWPAVEQRGYLVKTIRRTADGGVSIELHDLLAALDKLARIHGLYANGGPTTNTTEPVEFVLRIDANDLP